MQQINKNLFNNTKLAYISKSNKELKKSFFIFWILNNQLLVKIGTILLKVALKLKLPIKNMIKNTIFSQFCGGETLSECDKIISSLSKYNISAMPDYSVEGEINEEGFEKNMNKTINIITSISKIKLPFYVVKLTGLASFDSLEKISSNKNTNFSKIEYLKLKNRLDKICKCAADNNVNLLIDAEESWIQEAIDSVTLDLMKKYNKKKVILFLTFQCYRKGAFERIKNNYKFSQNENFYLGVKLVRGAFMEKERQRAINLDYDDPIQSTKDHTDMEFDASLEYCINNIKKISLWIGSHNENSFLQAISLMKKFRIKENDNRIWFSQLFGMSDNISYALADSNYNVIKLIPFGPVEKTIPYLIRRAKENSSVKGQTSRQFTLVKSEMKRRKILSLI